MGSGFEKCELGSEYPLNDIGIAKLFCELYTEKICYVIEAKSWYFFNGKVWNKDVSTLQTMEFCKNFTQELVAYAEANMDDLNKSSDSGDAGDEFAKYAQSFHKRRRREALLSDARSVAPKSLADFDSYPFLFNCANGTFNLQTLTLQPHNPGDFITKIARVRYDKDANCVRWDKFISEIMCEDMDTAKFLQKSLGYSASGDTSLECFFILYGPSTRNGKSTLTETVAHILGDFARTAQPQTLSRRTSSGSAPSPDIARLKGSRLVNVPELEKDIVLNSALMKQLTGGDTFTGRFLRENPFEYKPEFKIFINTNILPRIADSTIFASKRVIIIPFERHFKHEEQDSSLKKFFRAEESKSAILNWLIEGYRLLQSEGLTPSEKVSRAIADYKNDDDTLGIFLTAELSPLEGNRIKTSILHLRHIAWAKENGHNSLSSQNFVSELRRRYHVTRDCVKGNVIVGYGLKNETA